MKQTIYWKDMLQTILTSKGRFFSLFNLMMIGSLALVGLKVTAPNMERTAQAYIDQSNTMDLALMSSLGLDEEDVADLKSIEGAQVEMGYAVDRSLADSQKAIRIVSQPQIISRYQVQTGRLPQSDKEIALSTSLTNDYSLGQTVSFLETDEEGIGFKRNQFIVVGFVTSPEIWDTASMGVATSGDGLLAGYGVVDATVFDSDYYTIARLSYKDLENLAYYDPAYDQRLSQHQEELEKRLANKGKERLERIQSEGQLQIVQGQANIQNVRGQLAEGQQELDRQRGQVSEGQKKVDQAQDQLTDRHLQLQDGWGQLEQTKAALDQAKLSLDKQLEQLEETKSFLQVSQSDVDKVAQQLEQARVKLEENNQLLSKEGAALSSEQAAWYQAQRSLDAQLADRLQAGQTLSDYPELLEEQTRLDEQKERLDQALSAFNARQVDYQAGFELLQEKEASYQKSLAQYQEVQTYYEEGYAQYQVAYEEYQAGLEAYEAGLGEIQNGENQIMQAQEELAIEEQGLQEAGHRIDQAQADLQTQQGQRQADLTKAEEELKKSQTDLTNLKEPTYQVYTRSSIAGGDGYTTYKNATSSIAAVGSIFPTILYLVAALVTFTTMTRFVDEQRTQAGLLHALGYSKAQIMRKFVLYGLVAGMTGSLVGVFAGHYLLSPMISHIITQTTVIGAAQLSFYPSWTLLALFFASLSAVLPAYLVARKELMDSPASLLLPKPPLAGASILLEKLPFIWKKFSFTQKVTARNIVRYKKRMFMTVFGVAGTVALLFGGLGIRSSISGVVEEQFGQLIGYDVILLENSRADQAAKAELATFLKEEQVKTSLSIYYQQLSQKVEQENQSLSVGLFVLEPNKLSDLVTFRQLGTERKLPLDDSGVLVSQKMAQLLDLEQGDHLQLKVSGKTISVRVAGISQLYAGHLLYMTPAYFEKVSGEKYQPNAQMVQFNNTSPEEIKRLATALLEKRAVSLLIQNTSLITMLQTVAGSLQSIMLILVILSVLLGLVILYNLTAINLAERIRELSTIKVLGFHTREVTFYLYRETIVLSLLGIVLGLIGGIFLHRILLEMIGSMNIVFPAKLSSEVFLIPLVVIASILTGLGYYLHIRLKKLDMLDALKSNE